MEDALEEFNDKLFIEKLESCECCHGHVSNCNGEIC